MTTKQLENLVNGIKKPNLKSSEIDKLFQDDSCLLYTSDAADE